MEGEAGEERGFGEGQRGMEGGEQMQVKGMLPEGCSECLIRVAPTTHRFGLTIRWKKISELVYNFLRCDKDEEEFSVYWNTWGLVERLKSEIQKFTGTLNKFRKIGI